MSHYNRRKSSIAVLVRKSLHNIADPQCVLQRTERSLEHELDRETRRHSLHTVTKLDLIRSKGDWLLHTKVMLLTIVFLNVTDCALVLGEIMLDIHYVKDLMEQTESSQQSFLKGMQTLHPGEFTNHSHRDIHQIFEKLIDENWTRCDGWTRRSLSPQRRSADLDRVTYNVTDMSEPSFGAMDTGPELTNTSGVSAAKKELLAGQTRRASIQKGMAHGEMISHKLHYTSIAILSFLLVESGTKIFCVGLRFFRHPLEVFDVLVVLVSFIIDLVFLKGLTSFHVRELVFILTFILPWRIIRVLNSLLVAVLEHEHFRMKLLYSEKKQIATELKELKFKESQFEEILQKIEDYCAQKGIPRWKIQQHAVFRRSQENPISSLALGTSNLLNIMLQKRSICESMERAPPAHLPTIVTHPPRLSSQPDFQDSLLEEEEGEEEEDVAQSEEEGSSSAGDGGDDSDENCEGGESGKAGHRDHKTTVHFLTVPRVQR